MAVSLPRRNTNGSFEESSCTICTSIFQNLLKKYNDPLKVMEFVFARPYSIDRRLGEGVSVFNPGDEPLRQNVIHNEVIQRKLDNLFQYLATGQLSLLPLCQDQQRHLCPDGHQVA